MGEKITQAMSFENNIHLWSGAFGEYYVFHALSSTGNTIFVTENKE